MSNFIEKRLDELEPGTVFYLTPDPEYTPWRALNFRGTSLAWISHRDRVVPVQEVGAEDWGHIDYHWADAVVYVERPDRRQEDIGRWVEMRYDDIPVGAEYLPFGWNKPTSKDLNTIQGARTVWGCAPDDTRWVRLPDRRRD